MAIGNNDKLVGSLRLAVDKLKTDIDESNKILAGIDTSHLNLEIMDAKTTSETLQRLRAIKSEIDQLTKSGVDTSKLLDFTDKLTKSISSMKTSVDIAGSNIESTVTKIIDVVKKNDDEAVTSIKKTIESIDELGKKTAQSTTTRNYYDKDGNLSSQKSNYSTITTDSYLANYKSQLDAIDKKYLELNSTESKRVSDLKDLATETRTLASDMGLEGKAWNEAETKAKGFETEANKISTSIDKITQATEKQSLAELSLYTQEKAQTSQYDSMSKTLARISGESSLAMNSSNPNNSMLDRFKVSAAYTAASQSIYAVRQAFNDSIKTNEDYEMSLQDLKRVLGNVTDNEMKAFGNEAIKLAKDFGEPLQAVQDAMNQLATAGVQDKLSLDTMSKTVLTGLNTSEIKDAGVMTNYLVSSMKQLNISFTDSMNVLDSWNKLADTHVSKVSDFAEATSKAGSASKSMGIDIDHLNAMVAVLGDKTGVTGSEIGDAIKAMEARLETPKALKTLQQYGIEVMKDKDHFKDFGDIMTQVSEKMGKFGDGSVQNNDIETALGGTLRRNWIDILAKNYKEVDDVAKQSSDSIGYSATKNAGVMDTLAKKVETFNAAIKQFYIGVGDSGLSTQLKGIVDLGTWLATTGSKLSGFLLTIGEVSLGLKTISETMKIISGQNLTQTLDKLKMPEINLGNVSFGGATTSVKAYESAVNSLSQQIIEGNINAKQSAAILEVVRDKIGLAKTSTDSLRAAELALSNSEFASSDAGKTLAKEVDAVKVAQEGASVTAKGATASEEALNVAQKATAASALGLKLEMVGITLGLSLLIPAIISGITKLINSSQEARDKIKDLTDQMSTISQNDNLIKNYSDLQDQLNKTTKDSEEYNSIQAKMIDTQKQLAQAFPNLVDGYTKEGDAIVTNTKALQAYNNEQRNKILAEAGTQYSSLKEKLTKSSTVTTTTMGAGNDLSQQEVQIPSLIDKYNQLNSAITKALSEGHTAEAAKYAKQLIGTDADIQTLNKSAISLYSIGMKDVEYFDIASGKLVKYSDYLAENSKAQSDNGKATDDSTDSIMSLSDVEKELASSLNKDKSAIDEVNQLLDKHAKSGEWDYDTIIKLANNGYPELLGKMNDDKALETELISIKQDKIKVTESSLQKEIDLETKYINQLTFGYNFDITNFKTAQEAKDAMTKLGVNKRIQMYADEAQAALDAANAGTSRAAQDNALRGAMRSGDLMEVQIGKMTALDPAIDAYFQLKQLGSNADSLLNGAGSSYNDGKKGNVDSPSKSQSYTSSIEAIDLYKNSMDEVTESISLQEKSLSNLEKEAKAYADSKDYQTAMEKSDALLIAQKKHTDELKSSLSETNTIKSQIVSDFKNKYGVNINDNTTQAELENIYNSRFGGDNSFKNESQKKAFDESARYFKQLIDDLGTVNNQQDTINSKIDESNTKLKDAKNSLDDVVEKQADAILQQAIYGDQTQKQFENDAQIKMNAIQDQIDALNTANDLEAEQEQRLQNENDLLSIKTELQNTMNSKNVQLLKKQADGSWQFDYTYDESKVQDLQKQVQDKIKSNNKWEMDTAKKHQIDMLNQEKKAIQDEVDVRRKALEDIKADLTDYLGSDTKNGKIGDVITKGLDNINKLYGNKLDGIIATISSKVSDAKAQLDLLTEYSSATGETNTWKQNSSDANDWSYLGDNGLKVKDTWEKDSKGLWYYLDSSGNMATNTKTPDGYYVDANGVWDGQPKSFDTGGETGSWSGNEGKVAVVHQKERVLTSTQTEDFGELVTYLPTALTSMNDVMDKINLSNVNSRVVKSGDNYYQIAAVNFPDATLVDEIVGAFKSLPDAIKQKSS